MTRFPLVRIRQTAQAIAQALQATYWNAKAAAAHLQISYKALLYKMKQFQLRTLASHNMAGLKLSRPRRHGRNQRTWTG